MALVLVEALLPVPHSVSLTPSEVSWSTKKWVSLVLQDRPYDKKTPFRLVLRDAETGIEQQGVPVVIDRAFHDDF